MQEYSLRIPNDDAKAIALINYLETLDFVQLKKATDWWDDLSKDNQTSIHRGLKDIEKGNTFSHEEVSSAIKKRIEAARG